MICQSWKNRWHEKKYFKSSCLRELKIVISKFKSPLNSCQIWPHCYKDCVIGTTPALYLLISSPFFHGILDNVKALYRRARAHVGAWNPEQAKNDFKKVSTTQLLMHSVAHSTKPSSRPKTNNQSLKFLRLKLSKSCWKLSVILENTVV